MRALGRRHVIAALLLLTLLLSLWLEFQPPPAAEVVAAAPARPGPAAAKADRSIRPQASREPTAAGRAAWPEASEAALAAWSPPPPPAPPVSQAAPPKAKAPAFPYQWIGQLDDGESPQALLSSPQRSFGVRAGDVLEGRWRVERVASRGLQVTWLPTGDLVDVAAR